MSLRHERFPCVVGMARCYLNSGSHWQERPMGELKVAESISFEAGHFSAASSLELSETYRTLRKSDQIKLRTYFITYPARMLCLFLPLPIDLLL